MATGQTSFACQWANHVEQSGCGVLDSALMGFMYTVEMHLFTIKQ